MKKYIGTKEVSATPAWQIDGTIYPKDGVVPRSMNRKDGYKVVYEDGYESWSPKDVFEEAYRPSETVLDRLKIERDELKERIEKIEALLENGINEVVKKAGGVPQAVLLILQDSYNVLPYFGATDMSFNFSCDISFHRKNKRTFL